MNIALILAGGSGSRMGQDIPKQFLCVENKPVFIYTLENFQKCEAIDAIYITSLDGWEAAVSAYAKQFNITKLKQICPCGASRFDSAANLVKAVSAVASDEDVILIYDANRPLITNEIISDSIEKAQKHGAASGCIPSVDSLYIIDNGMLKKSAPRASIYRGQGPESMTYSIAREIFFGDLTEKLNLTPTEVLLKTGYTVATSKSSNWCIKLTTVEDILIFQAMLKHEQFNWLK